MEKSNAVCCSLFVMNSNHALETLFNAIRAGDAESVRALLSANRGLVAQRLRRTEWRFPRESELDAFKFLGAYIGRITPLQHALLMGQDAIARDIIDATFEHGLFS
jgi:hypothetical protein